MADSQLYPDHCKVSRETVMGEAVRVVVDVIKKLQGQERIQLGRHERALMKLLEIFQKKTTDLERIVQTIPQTLISSTRPENF